MFLDVKKLEEWSRGSWTVKPNFKIKKFCHDSRLIEPGDLFLAIKTDKRDGHEFLEMAMQAGAQAALVEDVNLDLDFPQLKVENVLEALNSIASNYRNEFKIPVIGITGSCGKTSTKEMLKYALGRDSTYATYANNNNLLGVPLSLLEVDLAEDGAAIIEAGTNQLGEIDQLGKIIKANIGIITCVGVAHSEFLGGKENIAKEKCKLLEHLNKDGTAIFPFSCYEYSCFRDIQNSKHILVHESEAVQIDKNVNEYYFEYNFKYLDDSILLILGDLGKKGREFKLPIMSEGMLQNAGLVILAARLLGVSDELIQERLLMWSPYENRGEVVRINDKEYYLDCYNSNPQSLIDSLKFFQHKYSSFKNRTYVIGGMGELGVDSAKMHYESGRRVKAELMDRFILIEKGFSEMKDFQKGLIESGIDAEQITMYTDLESVAKELESLNGAVFVKASKSVGLGELVKN